MEPADQAMSLDQEGRAYGYDASYNHFAAPGLALNTTYDRNIYMIYYV